MIVTVTPAPALDRTYSATEFLFDRVNRATSSEVEASGKGVNVARALTLAGVETVAVLPLGGPEGRQLAELLDADSVAYLAVPTNIPTRTNTTLAIAGQHTTKVNAPSPALPAAVWDDLVAAVGELLARYPGAFMVCSGSVPAGADELPARLVEVARRSGARSAIDSSGAALALAVGARPDLVAPNHLELAELLGVDPGTLDPSGAWLAGRGPGTGELPLVESAASWALELAVRTSGAVLVTLGASGALYVDSQQSWHAAASRIVPVNTVGAGDALLAGFLSVAAAPSSAALDIPAALATAVAWGTAACAMSGTSGDVARGADISAVTVRELARGPAPA